MTDDVVSENTVVLDSSKFSDFIRVLSIFKDLCNDVSINNGIIRQKSNDNVSIFEVDLTPMIGEISLPISNLKQKLDILKSFVGQEVTIYSNDISFKFSDNFSHLNFKNPALEFMDNKFITEEEINNVLSMEEEFLMLDTSITKMISERIKIISSGFNVNSLMISFNNGTSNILAMTQSKDQTASFMKDIIAEYAGTCYTHLTVIPFIIDHDNDMNLKVYENENSRALNKFSTTISDINVTVFCRSQIVSDLVEEEDNE